MVQFGVVAVFDVREAGTVERPGNVLSRQRALYGEGDYYAVGVADGDDGAVLRGGYSLFGCVYPRDDPGRPGTKDEQKPGQWNRSVGSDRQSRGRCYAVCVDQYDDADPGCSYAG